MPKFDLTINLGHVLIIASMVLTAFTTWNAFKLLISVKIAQVEAMLETHTEALTVHAQRLDRHEAVHAQLIGDVQRILGRLEFFLGVERRTVPRG